MGLSLILLCACWMRARGISTPLLGLGVFTQMENGKSKVQIHICLCQTGKGPRREGARQQPTLRIPAGFTPDLCRRNGCTSLVLEQYSLSLLDRLRSRIHCRAVADNLLILRPTPLPQFCHRLLQDEFVAAALARINSAPFTGQQPGQK